MPDLTTHSYWACETCASWQTTIDGHLVAWGPTPGGQCVYGWSCDCKGFKFRRRCRHADAAEPQRCGWQQFVHGGEPAGDRCPRCAAALVAESHAV
jgi:hypothetical protein